jgi:hypothetical protein
MRKIVVPLMALMITFGLLGVGTYGVFALPEDMNITAGNQYQGTSTKLNVKFYITAPSPDTSVIIPTTPAITPITPVVTPAIGVAALTEGTTTEGISVLAFTGLNPVIPLTGITLLLIGFFALVLEANRKRKMKLKNSIHKNI